VSFYQRILSLPFVFNRIRPLLAGGIDWKPLYEALDAGPDSVVLDVGCGMGIAHQYLRSFREYYGFDTDPVAIKLAQQLPFDDRVCDFITAVCVYHHVPAERRPILNQRRCVC